jgi:hypothetical protein
MADEPIPGDTPAEDPRPGQHPLASSERLAELADEELLDLQMRQLDIRIEGSALEPRIAQLH